MLVMPAETGVTTPVEDPIVAIPVAEEAHLPPEVPSLNVVADPVHTPSVPVMPTGDVLTVTMAVVLQPVGNV